MQTEFPSPPIDQWDESEDRPDVPYDAESHLSSDRRYRRLFPCLSRLRTSILLASAIAREQISRIPD
jgi:hypothetical protein